MRLHVSLLALSALVFAAPSLATKARASVVQALDLAALVQQADDVVVARVIRQESHYDSDPSGGREPVIVTDYTMQVERTEKGHTQPGAAVTVRKLGGVVGDRGMRIAGEPSFEVGEQVVLFGERNGRTFLRPVGMAQGAMRVFEQDGEQWARPAVRGLSLVGGNKSAASSGPKRLEELLGDVRAIMAAQR